MDIHERLRLLYVAATRACDHLVVSVNRKARGNRTSLTSAEVLYDEGWDPDLVELLDLSDEPPVTGKDTKHQADRAELPILAEWQSAHDAALVSASQPVAMSATRIAAEEASLREPDDAARRTAAGDPGLAKGPRDIDLPPWQKGRYGSAIGRAVHGVMQTVDLATGKGLVAACAAQAAAEGVLGKESIIEALARAALESDTVRNAAQSRYWREVYVGIPYGDGILEGYIDLLYEGDDGLVIVDYKTDSWRSDADLDAKVERYRVQLQAYAYAVRVAARCDVVQATLLFLRKGEAIPRTIELTGR
jgi:ATP-dependent helicase/nuclease subunit A